MTEFTIARQIEAPPETVWAVLDDFGDIQRWNDGAKVSDLTSDGPVSEGSTRHCDFAPFGAVDERTVGYELNQRMTIDLYKPTNCRSHMPSPTSASLRPRAVRT